MTTAWDVASNFILRREGGANNDPDDRGGPTTAGGLTEKGLAEAIRQGDLPAGMQLREVTLADVRLALHGVWRRLRCSDLPPAVALGVLDAAWLQGEQRAAAWLQEALVGLGAHIAVDGIVGFRTVSAAQAVSQPDLLHALLDLRRAAIASLIRQDPRQEKFRKGWGNRLRMLGDACLGLLEAKA